MKINIIFNVPSALKGRGYAGELKMKLYVYANLCNEIEDTNILLPKRPIVGAVVY